jgi:retron-type reverse transcriptase
LSDKPFAIPKQAVVEAFRKVRANQGGPGVDGCTIEEYESDLRNRLYVTWNRMSSGSYFPPPVKAVAVPKPNGGGVRMLGWGSPRTVDIEGGLPGGLAERMFTWRLQEDHSRRSTGLRPLIG